MERMDIKDNSLVRQNLARFRQAWEIWGDLRSGKISELPRFVNSLALILGRIASSGLGFLSWMAAARLYTAAEVGTASGVVSAMMLCVQLALVGIGSAFITAYPRHKEDPNELLNTANSMVTAFSLLTAGIFLLLASVLFTELRIVAADPLYSLLFIGIVLFGTINVLMDHFSIAQRRNDQVLFRNIIFGIITILAIIGLPILNSGKTSQQIVLAWTLAGLGACSLGALQMWKSLKHYIFKPEVNLETGKQLVRIGVPNYLLTLAERAPNWVLPILVLELMSPTDNAHWYTAWMMAWVVFIIPISIGQNLFAEVSHRPETLHNAVNHSTRTSLLLGGAAAVAVIIFAPWMLWLLGKSYATAGATPLRILSLAVLPMTYLQAYYAVCRGKQRLNEAILTGMVTGFAGVSAAALVGPGFGLTGMAIAWLVTQFLSGVWALLRLRALSA